MAGKMIACLERNFQRGREGAFIKGRHFYDLLWFMQKNVQPLAEKLEEDAQNHIQYPQRCRFCEKRWQKSVLGILRRICFQYLSQDLLLRFGWNIST